MGSLSIKKALAFAFKTFNSNFYKMFFASLLALLAVFVIKFGVIKLFAMYFSSDVSQSAPLLLQHYRLPMVDIIYYGIYFLMLVFIFLFFTSASKPLLSGGTFALNRFFPSFKINLKFLAGLIILELPIILLALGFLALSLFIVTHHMGSKWLSLWMLAQFVVLIATIWVCVLFTRYIFYYIALFGNRSLKEALKKSARITVDNRVKLFFAAIILGLVNGSTAVVLLRPDLFPPVFGALAIVIFVVAMPVTVLLLLSFYDQLAQEDPEDMQTFAEDVEDDVMGGIQKEKI